MKTDTPQTIYLKDYTPPAYFIDTVDLDFSIESAGTVVTATLAMRRNPALAAQPLAQAHSEWVRHKTTRRAHYAAFAPAAGSGVFDTILHNAAGEITETTFGNIAVLLDGRWITPPLACGLLPGVGRAVALRAGRVQEGLLRLQDVPRVQQWAFVNSLRGWLEAQLV